MIVKKIIFGILMIVVGTTFWSCQSPAESVKKIALENGINYLLTTDDQYISGSTLLAQRLSIECEHDELAKYLEGKYYDDLKHTGFLQERHATPESDDHVDLNKVIDRIERLHLGTDTIVIKASHCENISYESILSDIDQIKRDGSYNSAHILMALSKSRDKGCYEDKSEEISVFIEDLVDELTEAQSKIDRNNLVCNKQNIDIYAERALFISDAGFPLKDEWIENILKCQQIDGGWFSPHATGLSLLTIVKTLDDC